jgi:hypothetical protein
MPPPEVGKVSGTWRGKQPGFEGNKKPGHFCPISSNVVVDGNVVWIAKTPRLF